MKNKKRWVQLSPELERLAMCSVLKGVVPYTDVHQEELSKVGKVVLQAVENISESGSEELHPQVIETTAAEILGADRGAIKTYLSGTLASGASRDVRELLRITREKCALVDILNEAGNQLASGKLDVGRIETLVGDTGTGALTIQSASDLLVNGIPSQPVGVRLRSLPTLSQASGGLMGMWAIAAESGVGKSTLALQLAVEYARVGPVLYYDAENGPDVMLYRLGKRYDMNVVQARAATERVYFRDSIRTLNADLKMFAGQSCLIVVDSLQKLPASVEHRRTALGAWVYRLEALKKKGHCVLLISEKSREQYGVATQRGFKESGEVEYTADFGFQLLPEKELPTMMKIVIVKNRHRPIQGNICGVERVNFTFQERA